MKSNSIWQKFFLGCFMLLLAGAVSYAASENETTYHDPDGKYQIVLPANWQAVNFQDGAGHPRVEIIYRDRAYGLLKISQEQLAADNDLDNFIHNDIDQNLRFRPGYVFNGTERFVGENLRGQLLQFDFTHGGSPKKGRNYYLKGDGPTVWVLRFTGNRDVFTPLRHETDAIARSFKLLK